MQIELLGPLLAEGLFGFKFSGDPWISARLAQGGLLHILLRQVAPARRRPAHVIPQDVITPPTPMPTTSTWNFWKLGSREVGNGTRRYCDWARGWSTPGRGLSLPCHRKGLAACDGSSPRGRPSGHVRDVGRRASGGSAVVEHGQCSGTGELAAETVTVTVSTVLEARNLHRDRARQHQP